MSATPVDPAMLFKSGMDTLRLLGMLTRHGDAEAAKAIMNLGLQAAGTLEEIALDETREEPAGGAVRQLAREAINWPHRLSAFQSIRNGPSTGNPEKFAAFLRLGSQSPFALEEAKRGRQRDFQGKTGFALKVFKIMQSDLRRYGDMSGDSLLKERYHAWSYQTREGKDPMSPIPIEKPQPLHQLFADYVAVLASARDLKGWVEAAVLWARVDTEDDIEKDHFWPKRVYLDATGVAGGVEAQLRKRFRSGFRSLLKGAGSQTPI